MNSNKKENIPNLRKIIYLLILIVLSVSCNWNSSEKGNSEKAESDPESEITPQDSSYIVDVTAVDYAFGMPTEIPSGWVTFRMKNMGQAEHNAIIHKYVDTLQYETLTKLFSEALEGEGMQGFSKMFEGLDTDMGGPAILSPNHTGETTVFLEPGVYTLTCWMVAEDGEYHLQKGMNRPFIVTNEESGAEKPEGTVGITLSDLAIDIEDPIGAGEHVFDVNFEASHNVHLAKLGKDQKMEDLESWMNKVKTPSSFTFLGGAEQAPAGMSSTFKASLEPGRYALVTYGIADSGMREEIIVPEEGKAPAVENQPVNAEKRLIVGKEQRVLPESLPIGRTPLIVQNPDGQDYQYFLSFMKDGYSTEDYLRYINGAYVEETIDFMKEKPPYEDVWVGVVKAGEEKKINIELKNKQYILAGPLLTDEPWTAQWAGESMVHSLKAGNGIEGVKKQEDLQ